MSQSILFEDVFDVRQINPDGKKFDRIHRLHCRGSTFDVDLVVDINSELFDVRAGDKLAIALASTLSLDGTPDDGMYNPNPGPSLLDSYDYVMNGRLYKIAHIENQTIEIQASFGGLLFRLIGEQSQLDALQADMRFYILMRKGGIDTSIPMEYS
mmetsp:Transcript_27361/g.27598  ORF Transcript_27361/g.27598 Transcript_27361/m.27598 type:complete len:155 (-) Transcript_27361:60-524(-)